MQTSESQFLKKKKPALGLFFLAFLSITGLMYYSSLTISTDNAQLKIKNVKLFSVVSGEVIEVFKEDGDLVELNEAIFKINDIVYRNQLESITAKYNYVLTLYKKQKDLYEKKLISESEFLQIKMQKEEVEAGFEIAKYMHGKTTASAPIKGVLTNFNLKKGDMIAERTFLGNLIDCSDVWVEANFKEIDAKHLKKGSKATVVLDYDKSKKFKAVVSDVYKAVNSEFSLLPSQNISGNWIKVTQRLKVKLKFTEEFDNQCKFFKSGLNAEVKVFK